MHSEQKGIENACAANSACTRISTHSMAQQSRGGIWQNSLTCTFFPVSSWSMVYSVIPSTEWQSQLVQCLSHRMCRRCRSWNFQSGTSWRSEHWAPVHRRSDDLHWRIMHPWWSAVARDLCWPVSFVLMSCNPRWRVHHTVGGGGKEGIIKNEPPAKLYSRAYSLDAINMWWRHHPLISPLDGRRPKTNQSASVSSPHICINVSLNPLNLSSPHDSSQPVQFGSHNQSRTVDF